MEAAIPSPQLLDSNFCDRNAAGDALITTSVITFLTGTVLVALRLYTRIFIVKSFGWDDAALIPAYALAIVGNSLQWTMVDLGAGRRSICTSAEDTSLRTKIEWVTTSILGFSVIFTRISVIALIIRLFAVKRWVRWSLYGYALFMALSLAIPLILLWFVCDPIAALWNPALLPTAKCWSTSAEDGINFYNGAVSAFSDLLLAVLPGFFLSTLKIGMRAKLGIGALMSVGLLTTACAIARTTLTPTEEEADPSYNGVVLLVFGTLEMNMAIIAAAVPGLPALFKKTSNDSTKLYKPSYSSFNKTSGAFASNRWIRNKSYQLDEFDSQDRDHSPSSFGAAAHREPLSSNPGILVTRRTDVSFQ